MSTMVDSRWDSRYQPHQGPITSGFVSNSDIQQKERKEQIKWERQREYDDLMTKQNPPVYYKTGATELSLPLGRYEESRRVLDDQRQQEYNQYITQKKDLENKRREELYMNARQNYKPPPEPEMYDHNQISKDLREERQKEYNDYLKRKQAEESSRIKQRHRYTPPGGLSIGQYDIQRKRLRDELRREYKDSLLKQRQDQLVFRAKEFQLDSAPEYLGNLNEERPLVGSPSPRNFTVVPQYQREHENQLARHRKPPTPPGGLNIATEQERKRIEDMKKTTYRDELLKQQKEQLYNRAQQQGEVPVLNRASPTQALANRTSPRSPPRGRPPPHPDSGRRRGPPPQDERMGQNSMPEGTYRPQDPEFRTGFFDDRRRSPPNRDERQHDYQDYLAKKQREDEYRRQKLEEQRHVPQTEIPKGDFYSSETYEQKRRALQEERHGEYKDFLSKTNRPSYRQFTPESLQGLPIGQKRYDQLKHFQEVQRNKEYNEHLAKKTPDQGRREWLDQSEPKGIIAGIDSYNYDKRKMFAEERKKEYKDIMEKQTNPVQAAQTKVQVPVPADIEPLERKPTTPINLNAVKIFPVGEGYAKVQRELQEERKKNFKAFAEKKSKVYQKQKENRDHFIEMLDRELMESPPILPVGEYDTKKRHFKQEAHDEMIHYLERQPHGNRDKEFWNKVSKPRILPQSGEYKNRKQKLNDELRKDWRDYVLKQEPPKERIKEFGTPGAVLFTGEYEKTRQKVREERTKDYHEHLKKFGNQQPKRMPDQPPSNSIGFMASLGFHERERDKLNKERQGEYRKYLDEKAYGKDGMPRGRPNWVDGKESWFRQEPPPFNRSPAPGRDQEPPRDRPGSYRRRQTPSYDEILESKRKQEMAYRRFDDPEYSRTGGQGGYRDERPYERYD